MSGGSIWIPSLEKVLPMRSGLFDRFWNSFLTELIFRRLSFSTLLRVFVLRVPFGRSIL